MFENPFRKDPVASAPKETPQPHAAQAAPELSPEEVKAWQERIAAAQSDDALLLQLAHEAPNVDLKLAALHALRQEESLRQAMCEFRDHDKRLLRAAKTHWQAVRTKRETISEAESLIATARTLLAQEVVPANRVAELDRAWGALEAALLDPALHAQFPPLRAELGTRVRMRGEGEQAITRWVAAVDTAVAELRASLADVAQGVASPMKAESLAAGLLELLGSVADEGDVRCIEKGESAKRALALASSVAQRAEFLTSLPAPGVGDAAAEKAKTAQWREFPEVADGDLQSVLANRYAEWRNDWQREHNERRAHEHEHTAEQSKQRLSALTREVEAAEAAHAAGQVAELTRLMTVIDRALKRGAVDGALNQRIVILRAEQLRLRDWQRWGGGQAREELVAEAQALATAGAGKIAVKAHAEAIDKLRERWKELDKLGGATSKPLWLSFDGALKTAYEPVAAHLEKLKAARTENLQARNQIIDGLKEAAQKFFPAAAEGTAAVAEGTAAAVKPDLRIVARTLEEAKVAWRKLGPIEHTVPRKAQQGAGSVSARYAKATQALEAPLAQAYQEATREREQLIAAARTLAGAEQRDVVRKVQELQAQWQAHAKALPLPRREENNLWTAFKAATDAIFAERDAARAAKEAEFGDRIKARTDIMARVVALASSSDSSEIKRVMSESETAWRAAPNFAGPQAAKLETRYRAARDAARKRLAELATHALQACYDALLSAMALCGEREAATDSGTEPAADLQARFDAIADFPPAWKAKLETRLKGAAPSGEKLPEILLNLEAACGIESPEEFHAARQALKLRALKAAMEARQATVVTPADIERWLLDAAATPRPDEASRERLTKIIAAVRVRRTA